MREVMEEFRPILASQTIERTVFTSPQTAEPRQAPYVPWLHPPPQALQLDTHTVPVQAVPVGGGQPQHHATNWDLSPLSDPPRPLTSTFDFNLNIVQNQDPHNLMGLMSLFPPDDLYCVWPLDDSCVMLFMEELNEALPPDNVHTS